MLSFSSPWTVHDSGNQVVNLPRLRGPKAPRPRRFVLGRGVSYRSRLVLCPAPAWALCLGLERSRTQGIFERARRTASELFDIAGRHIEAADGPHLLNAEDGVHHGWR